MLTDEQIAEWRRLADGATAGPWKHVGIGITTDPTRHVVAKCPVEQPVNSDMRDAAFIAASRVAVPALCEEVERLRRGLREILIDCGRERTVSQRDCVGAQRIVDNLLAGWLWDGITEGKVKP